MHTKSPPYLEVIFFLLHTEVGIRTEGRTLFDSNGYIMEGQSVCLASCDRRLDPGRWKQTCPRNVARATELRSRSWQVPMDCGQYFE